ncbi:MAG: FtsX-like permease family protein [Archangium sp.]|nr:FtsX-like permease family protein [Archangium sp.]
MIDRVVLLVRIAIRNLLASPINLLIGGLILLGTLIFVLLGGMLDSLNQSMQRSVVGSLAGHLQIYSAASKDELALFGQMGNFPDLPAINDFPKIQEALSKVDNVKVVVPMGISAALITSGNIVDATLEKLRNLYKARDGQAGDPKLEGVPKEELERRIASEISHVRQIIKVLRGDVEKAMADMISAKSVEPRNVEALKRVEEEAFWAAFETDPYGNLEFLENRIAPIVTDTSLVFLRYVGTDLDKFQKSFDRMRIVKGSPVPQGQRGFLIADLMHEDQMKLKTARRLDKLKDARANGRLIATDDELKRFVKENRHQTRELVLQLDGIKTAALVTSLQGVLASKETGIDGLLSQLLDTTDENFDQRYQQFYELLVPQVQLYRVKVGDMLTIKAFTKSGYIQNVNVKVYGTFAFTGLEKSPLAGATSLMDLMSFRELFGYLTSDKAEELKEIQRNTGAKTVSRENAEAELFGEGADEVIAEATPGIIDPDAALAGTGRKLREEDLIRRVYTQQQLDDGVVLHAAVMLKDPSKLDETIAKIQQAAKDQALGIQVVSWQKASGLLGQIINVFRALLFVAVGIIFIAAMLIMYLSVLMATLQRTQMFGTMRAIGAQRGMILSMVLIESLVLGVIFGGLGMVAGAGVLALIATRGIAAPNDVMYFFFSGPRLIPQLSTWPLVVAMVIILVVTIGSTLLPALMAMRVSPLRAMQADE